MKKSILSESILMSFVVKLEIWFFICCQTFKIFFGILELWIVQRISLVFSKPCSSMALLQFASFTSIYLANWIYILSVFFSFLDSSFIINRSDENLINVFRFSYGFTIDPNIWMCYLTCSPSKLTERESVVSRLEGINIHCYCN